jgi:predicted metal-dependent phosphoesterase TrpH
VLALTDHDDTSGVPEALAAGAETGIRVVPGIELSVTWNATTIHIVGLHINPACTLLQSGLARLRTFRDWRAEQIARDLEKHGVREAFAGARALARGNVVSRTHFAHYLVSQGFGKNVRDVFQHFLRRNKPGYVPGQWAALSEAVGWITASGGLAVLAHPARYGLSATRRRRLMAEFSECGGLGLEVVSGSHTPHENVAMGAEARRNGLLGSLGSDFHGPENPWIELGRLPELPPDVTPIWQSQHWPSDFSSLFEPSPSLLTL